MLNLQSSSALVLVVLASLADTANAQCFDNNNFNDNCDDGGNWNNGYTAAVAIAIAALLLFLLLYASIVRRRRYALSQHPAVKPPMFGTAPPPGYAYTNGLPFWNPNANRAPAPAYEAEMAPPAYPYGKAAKAANEDGIEEGYAGAGAGASTAGLYVPPAGPPFTAGPYAPPTGPPPPPQAHTADEHGYELRRQQ